MNNLDLTVLGPARTLVLLNGDRTGHSVSVADHDGDGIADLLIGSPFSEVDGHSSAGAGFSLFGGDWSSLLDVDFETTAGHTEAYLGAAAVDNAGYVTTTAKLHSMGYADWVIAAPYADPGSMSAAGSLYVLNGGKRLGHDLDLGALGKKGVMIEGEAAGDHLGDGLGRLSIAGLRDRLVVSAPDHAGPGTGAGRVYVTADSATWDANWHDILQYAGAFIDGDAGAALGASISCGDADGDGKADLFMGAPGLNSNHGGAYLFYNAASLSGGYDSSDLDGITGTEFLTSPSAMYGGERVALGDINGDGVADQMVTASQSGLGGQQFSGSAFIHLGSSKGMAAVDLSVPNGTDTIRIDGDRQFMFLGGKATAIADLDGDGFNDIILAADAYTASNGHISAGEIVVIRGKAAGFDPVFNISDIDGTNGWRIFGGENWAIGSSLEVADLNGDDLLELVVGTESGRAAIVWGQLPTGKQNLTGSAAGQTMHGGNQGDKVSGLGGNDLLLGHGGSDQISGGNGKDSLEGGAGADSLNGGKGVDTVRYLTSDGPVTVDLELGSGSGDGGDTLTGIENVVGSNHNDTLGGDGKGNLIEGRFGADLLEGRDGNDTLKGDEGNDELRGEAGDDRLDGGDENDTLRGGDGADTLTGGKGKDRLYGGDGGDRFVFGSADESRADHPDRIGGFDSTDVIDLTGIDANSTTGANDAFTLVNDFSGHAGELIVIDIGGGSGRAIIGDTDGDGVGNFAVLLDGYDSEQPPPQIDF
ncbi:MAG: calcium-binding protein [Caulobacteraceae bacterium]